MSENNQNPYRLRIIGVPLGDNTTDTHCKDCKNIGYDMGPGGSGYPLCRIFQVDLSISSENGISEVLRCQKCRLQEID